MIVRNITGSTVVYSFASLTLSAGQTAEIDNSFLENVDFQIAVTNQTIAVVEYEQDPVVYNTRITISQSPDQPSNTQKGAMVAANEPSATNPFVTHVDTNYNDLLVSFNNATTIDVAPLREGRVTIKYVVYIDSTLQYSVSSGKVIDSFGVDTLTVPLADTIYYLYMANSNHPLGEKALAASTTAPASGEYLTSSKNWRHIGMFGLNSSSQLENNLCVASAHNEDVAFLHVNDLSSTQNAVASSTFENFAGTEKRILSPLGWKVEIHAKIALSTSSVPEVLEIALNNKDAAPAKIDASVRAETTSTDHYLNTFFYEKASAAQQVTYALKMRGPNTNHSCDLTTIKVLYKRYK